MFLKTKQEFMHLPLGDPLTARDLQDTEDTLACLVFRRKSDTVLCRWGWRREPGKRASYQGFWTLDGSQLPSLPWNTYGTDWQAYRINLPRDIRDIAVSFRWR